MPGNDMVDRSASDSDRRGNLGLAAHQVGGHAGKRDGMSLKVLISE